MAAEERSWTMKYGLEDGDDNDGRFWWEGEADVGREKNQIRVRMGIDCGRGENERSILRSWLVSLGR